MQTIPFVNTTTSITKSAPQTTIIKKTKPKQATETEPKRKKEEEESTGACEASNHYNPPYVTIPKSKPMYQTKIEERNRGTKEKTNQNHRRPPSPNPTKLSSPAAAKSPCSHRRSHERRRTSLSQHLLPSPARHHFSPSHPDVSPSLSGFIFSFPVLLF
jgi:hypothetical protein